MTHDEPLDYRQEPFFVVLLSSDGSKQLGSFAPVRCALRNAATLVINARVLRWKVKSKQGDGTER